MREHTTKHWPRARLLFEWWVVQPQGEALTRKKRTAAGTCRCGNSQRLLLLRGLDVVKRGDGDRLRGGRTLQSGKKGADRKSRRARIEGY